MSSSQLLTAFVFIMRYNILPDIYQEQWKDVQKEYEKQNCNETSRFGIPI